MSAATSKKVLESFRDVVQDLLVPELKAMKVSLDLVRVETRLGDEKLEQSVRLGNEKTEAAIRHLADRFDSLREEIKLRDAALERMIAYGDQRNEQLILSFSQKFGDTMELRERLARLEAQRAPQ